jgi:hypothetical protein
LRYNVRGVTRRSLGVFLFAITVTGCGGGEQSGVERPSGVVASAAAAPKPLQMRALQGSVVRMGSLPGEPLYGVRLRAFVCSRSSGEADRTYPTSFRIAHYVTSGRTARAWGEPFRILDNDLHWLVPLGETRAICGNVEFEDFIPPSNYGGVESPLGVMGYSPRYRCYGVRVTVRAVLDSRDRTATTRIAASRRAIIQCGRFRPS